MNKPLLQVAKDGLFEMVIEGVISCAKNKRNKSKQ